MIKIIDLTQFISENFLIGLLIILVNGVITGFAVYLGTHAGKRTVDKFKKNNNQENKKTDVEEVKEEQKKEIEKNIIEKDDVIVRENTNIIWKKCE